MSAADHPINMTDEDIATAKSYWDQLILDDDGNPVLSNIYAELFDYQQIIAEVRAVYHHITCGKLSKPNYLASGVIQVSDECVEQAIGYAVRDVLEMIEDGETVETIKQRYPLNE